MCKDVFYFCRSLVVRSGALRLVLCEEKLSWGNAEGCFWLSVLWPGMENMNKESSSLRTAINMYYDSEDPGVSITNKRFFGPLILIVDLIN